MTRDEIKKALLEELDSLTDEDLALLTSHNYGDPQIWFRHRFPGSSSSLGNANTCLHCCNVPQARAQHTRLQKIRKSIR